METESGWRRTGTKERKEESQETEPEAAVAKSGVEERQEEDNDNEEILQGIASIALFPSGSLSGHFLHTASSTCLGLFGTEIACERECSHGEDYRLLNLTIVNFKTKKETTVVVERRGEDAARLSSTCDLHGWDEEVVQRHSSSEAAPLITFECETLKADTEAEEHVKKFSPSLIGRDAVVNIGRMTIKGLSLSGKEKSQVTRVTNPKRSLEDTLRLVLGEVDDHHHSAALKKQMKSQPDELHSFIKSTPTHRVPCDSNDDF